jgi:membrane-bound ClpP family serine protease
MDLHLKKGIFMQQNDTRSTQEYYDILDEIIRDDENRSAVRFLVKYLERQAGKFDKELSLSFLFHSMAHDLFAQEASAQEVIDVYHDTEIERLTAQKNQSTDLTAE